MLWLIISRPLAVMATLAGIAVLSPVLLPLTKVLVKPLVKPLTILYLDIAEEIGEVVEEREKLKARKAPEEKKVSSKRAQDKETKEIEAGTAVLDEASKLLL
jgi:hypothetical protein